jgi:hypothetical protein
MDALPEFLAFDWIFMSVPSALRINALDPFVLGTVYEPATCPLLLIAAG